MIHTVLGDITGDRLGMTLMHEHISWDRGWRSQQKVLSSG